MRVLMLCRYSPKAASSRLRSHQYVNALTEHGIDIQVHCLFSNLYLDYLYTDASLPLWDVLKSYFRRTLHLIQSNNWDIVWIEKEALPWVPGWLEKLLLGKTPKLILDYDDAVFHRYDQHSNGFVRFLLSNKIPALMRRADLVIAGNAYIAEFANSAESKRVVNVATSVDISKYAKSPATHRKTNTFTLGWIGTPYTARYLKKLAGVFQELEQSAPIEFQFVGAPAGLDLGVKYQSIPWSESNEANLIQNFDCGIMPLDDNPFERGKCGYKIIQYFACSVPVVASPVGVNVTIVKHGTNGFLAKNNNEWLQHINSLRNNLSIAKEFGRKGRQLVEEKYSTRIAIKKIMEALSSV